MTHHITADHLVDAATKAVTEELFREFDKALQSFCNEEQDRRVIFRTLRYARIRLHVLQKYLPDDEAATRNTQNRFLKIALGYINTELELLARYRGRAEAPATRMRWTGTLVELVELIYGLQEMVVSTTEMHQSTSCSLFLVDYSEWKSRRAIVTTPIRI